jgi:hypothetical protein
MLADRSGLCARLDRSIHGPQSNVRHNPRAHREGRRGVDYQQDLPDPTRELSIFSRQWSIESLHRSLFLI